MKRAFLILLVNAFSLTAHAAWEVPKELPIPSDMVQVPAWTDFHDYAEYKFDTETEKGAWKRGHSGAGNLYLPNPPATSKETRDLLESALQKAGWKTIPSRDGNPTAFTMRYADGAKELWLSVHVLSHKELSVYYVDVVDPPVKLELKSPDMPETSTFSDRDDFPFLTAYPLTLMMKSIRLDSPMNVSVNQSNPEFEGIGGGSILKTYSVPKDLSNLQFSMVYEDALTRAGWTVVYNRYSPTSPEVTLLAHYVHDGRDLWVRLHKGSDITFQAADAGNAEAMLKSLRAACHVPLYGIHFVPDKAMLKPESGSVLEQVAQMLKNDPKLAVDIQGNTDNSGNENLSVNQSLARAESVKAWLVKQGIDFKRLTAKGIGSSLPAVPNTSDENRAMNRRIELAVPNCKSR